VVTVLTLVIGSFLRSVVLRPVQSIGRLCSEVTSGNFKGRVDVRSGDEIGVLARTVNTMVDGLRERFELTKYVSAGTIDSLSTSQEPRRVLRTLLFTDVRGFTSFTERRPPEQVVQVLNLLLDRQSEIIQRHGGDIDKFAGDEIVAVFSGDDAPRRACAAAFGIADLCRRNAVELQDLVVGAGVATGSVIQGRIGSLRRADFTVIGDSVNLASRLCSLAKGLQVVVSDSTKTAAETAFQFRGPYSVKVKGKSDAQRVWLLAGPVTRRSP